jgi:hypothetical protein
LNRAPAYARRLTIESADRLAKGDAMAVEPEDLILVAIVNRPKDLEIARTLGWYRIPLQTAPKTVRVDWLAFYQTAAFGDERWSVRYVAPVRGFELTTRADLLRDEPAHRRAQEPYYKLQLGPLQSLPTPIPGGGWKRFTFLFTTGERLLTARILRDLSVPSSADRDQLWRLLKERLGG